MLSLMNFTEPSAEQGVDAAGVVAARGDGAEAGAAVGQHAVLAPVDEVQRLGGVATRGRSSCWASRRS